MALRYEPPPSDGPLRQGELLGPIWEHQSTEPPTEVEQGASLAFVSIHHALVIVLSQDCDLLWDFEARFTTDAARAAYEPEAPDIDSHASCITHVIACDAYEHDELRPRISGSDLWRRIKNNQDERYHRLEAAPIEALTTTGEPPSVPDVFLDFKKALALPTRQLYAGLRAGGVRRLSVVPPIYIHDVVHRFYGYHSRVALPVP